MTVPAIRRAMHNVFPSAEEQVRMAHAHAVAEARAVLLRLAPTSPQARRLARAMEALTDFLWPDDSPRAGEERNDHDPT
jgi:hypothetical protein